MLMISILVCIYYICQYIGLTIILVYCVTCSRRSHTATCCSTSYLWCSNNTQLLTAIYLPATYITTSNTHKHVDPTTYASLYPQFTSVKSRCYINTQNDVAESRKRSENGFSCLQKTQNTQESGPNEALPDSIHRYIRAIRSSKENWSLLLQTHAVNKRQDIKVAPKCSVSHDVVSATPPEKVYLSVCFS